MWSWRFARVAGIDLKVHLSFLLIIAVGAMQWGGFGLRGAIFGAVLTLLTFASVTLHELGHALVALGFKIPVKDITLYPIGGVARLGKRPKTPMQEFLVAIAGPAVNVVLALIIGALGSWLYGQDALIDAFRYARTDSPSMVTLVAMLAASNAILAVFNMIPALPMDGGRVLRSMLSGLMGNEHATKTSAWISRVLSVGLFAFGLYGNPMLCIVAVFVFFGAGQEVQEERLARVLDGVASADAVNPYAPRFSPDTTLGTAIATLTATHWDAFAVEHHGRLVGVVTRAELLKVASKEGAWGYVAGAMNRDTPPSIEGREPIEAARFSMSESGLPYVAVIHNNMFLGLITELDLAYVTERLVKARFTRREGNEQTAVV